MRSALLLLSVLAGCAVTPPNKPGVGDHHLFIPGIAAEQPAPLTGAQALTRLQEGNQRFVAGTGHDPQVTAARSLARVHNTGTEGQHPIAAVLTCADSRTPPELFLDQGFGDVFVVRVAGNVTDPMGLASLEYAVDHLGVPLVVVIGHTRCGAVDAAVKAVDAPSAAAEPSHPPEHYAGNLPGLVDAIEPAVRKAQRALQQDAAQKGKTPSLLNASIRQNVLQSIAQLSSRSPVLAREISSGDLLVVGAVYDVERGSIEWMNAPLSSHRASLPRTEQAGQQ